MNLGGDPGRRCGAGPVDLGGDPGAGIAGPWAGGRLDRLEGPTAGPRTTVELGRWPPEDFARVQEVARRRGVTVTALYCS